MSAALKILAAELARMAGPEHWREVQAAFRQLELEFEDMQRRLAELERKDKKK